MHFDPNRHHRRSIRLRGYDYTQPGAYFVTICEINRACIFGEIRDGEMRLNDLGSLAEDCWVALPEHFPNVELAEYIVMPNHVHGILVVNGQMVGARHASPLPNTPLDGRPHGAAPGSVGAIMGSYKSAVSKRINLLRDTPGNAVFQRNYYEHVIRNEREHVAIAAYICGNPANWPLDTDNPKNAAKNQSKAGLDYWRHAGL